MNVKEGIVNQIRIIIYMFLFNIISFGITYLALTDFKYDGQTMCGLLTCSVIKLNMYIYIPCMVLLLVLFSVFWSFVFKKYFIKSVENHLLFIIIYVLILVCFAFVNTFLCFIVEYVKIDGLFNEVNYPKVFMYIQFLYPVLYMVVSIINLYKKKKNT